MGAKSKGYSFTVDCKAQAANFRKPGLPNNQTTRNQAYGRSVSLVRSSGRPTLWSSRLIKFQVNYQTYDNCS